MSAERLIFSFAHLLLTLMYIVVIAWIYIAILMSVAEANASNGTILGAIITFLLYGLLPLGILSYIMGTQARKRTRRAADPLQVSIDTPNTGRHSPADTVPTE